jgi:hypothetical protein
MWYIPHPSHSSWRHHLNNIWWVHITNLSALPSICGTDLSFFTCYQPLYVV